MVIFLTDDDLIDLITGVMKFTREIVRIGGRCQTEELQPFTVDSLKRNETEIDPALARLELLLGKLTEHAWVPTRKSLGHGSIGILSSFLQIFASDSFYASFYPCPYRLLCSSVTKDCRFQR